MLKPYRSILATNRFQTIQIPKYSKKKNKENREKEEEIGAKIDRRIDNFPDE